MTFMKAIRLLIMGVLLAFTLTACANQQPETMVPIPTEIPLTPYYTETPLPSLTPTLTGQPTATPRPTATPTPLVYTIKTNDTLITIAYTFGITVADLQTANPGVNPNMLSIGSTLIIPPVKVTPGAVVPSPTPFGVTLAEATCYTALSGGLHCFAVVENPKKKAAENLSAAFTLGDSAAGETLTRIVPLALNRLPAGSRLPFYIFFPAPIPKDAAVHAALLTATQADEATETIIPLSFEDLVVNIQQGGLSATLSGRIRLADTTQEVYRIVIAVAAYNLAGETVGLRRIEQEITLSAGDESSFEYEIFSAQGPIHTVEVLGEAYP
jgi:LysM repeat protein